MYESYGEYPPWSLYDQPYPAAYQHQQQLPPPAQVPVLVPMLHPRITLAGSLDPATGIFYRTPEHPRLRTAQACEKCRARKAKCSGEHPSCGRCLARGLVCEYAREGRIRGPNKPKDRAHLSSYSAVQAQSHANALSATPADPPVKRRSRNRAPASSPVKVEPLSSCVPLALKANPKHLGRPTRHGFAGGDDGDNEYLGQCEYWNGGAGDYVSCTPREYPHLGDCPLGGSGSRDYLNGASARDYPHLGSNLHNDEQNHSLGLHSDYPDYPTVTHSEYDSSSAAYNNPYPDSPSSPQVHTHGHALHQPHPLPPGHLHAHLLVLLSREQPDSRNSKRFDNSPCLPFRSRNVWIRGNAISDS